MHIPHLLKKVAGFAVSLLIVLLSGCGGGGGSTSSTGGGSGGTVTSSSITLPTSVEVVSAK